ncbi:MAG: glycosyltransferase family 4 protein [Candidatus Acididesulfobacter diazotrophicus]|jgi:glycosyltransferase involved in cell wall biosynthesis|uniref:Glycosyltransferase family 4 protein n=1 Tax=Candidatus Acididesulfobacter diazotrophicus TaxID=2597226 RepID=A0A519BKG7_9DELT|nr:MAG: glycosyltransferase family 4 protein [Candidatus Acididesulfobacter diazotrophicus]
MKIALVHDWFNEYAGSERVVEQILECYPEADVFSIVNFLPKEQQFFLKNKKIHTSFIQNLPFARKAFRKYLLLMPFAVEQFDLTDYDLVISSSHAFAKGVITHSNQLHISYVHTPIRYAWDFQFQYLKNSNLEQGLKSIIAKYMLHKIRLWDYRTANGVDFFIANSKYVSLRIWKTYRRESEVIYPPVNIDVYNSNSKKDNFYLTVSRMVPYKRVDLVVKAFSQMPDKKLVVIGDGPELNNVRKLAAKNIEILGYQTSSIVKEYMEKAKCFVFAAEEDFGIVSVEAQACGTPVIAYGRGGATESVINNETGIFFKNQNVEDIINAVKYFEINYENFNPINIRRTVERFSVNNFKKKFKNFVDLKFKEKFNF